MKYNVTFARFGFATIEANSEQEAMEIAKGYAAEDISWSEDIDVTDAQEDDFVVF